MGWIVAALENAVVVGGLTACGAGLFSIGIPKDSVLKYETAIKTGKYVVIAHGSAADTQRAREVIAATDVDSSDCYPSA